MTALAALRPAVGADANFVISSWLKSFFKSRHLFSPLAELESDYFRGHHQLVESLLQRAQVIVACDTTEADQIFGWICFERPSDRLLVLHYAYVKAPYRGFGLGRQLLRAVHNPDVRTVATHWTRRLRDDKAELKYRLEVNPYLAMVTWQEAA